MDQFQIPHITYKREHLFSYNFFFSSYEKTNESISSTMVSNFDRYWCISQIFPIWCTRYCLLWYHKSSIDTYVDSNLLNLDSDEFYGYIRGRLTGSREIYPKDNHQDALLNFWYPFLSYNFILIYHNYDCILDQYLRSCNYETTTPEPSLVLITTTKAAITISEN